MFYAKSRKTSLSFVEESFDVYEGETLKKELFNLGDYKSFDVKDYELTEILSPASKSSYKQAIYGGADAIYFGYKAFNARAGGENFESIKEVVDFCHFYNVKAYLALNICFTNSELPQDGRTPLSELSRPDRVGAVTDRYHSVKIVVLRRISFPVRGSSSEFPTN